MLTPGAWSGHVGGRGPAGPQLPPAQASRRSDGSSDRISSRTGCWRSSSASTYGITGTPLTTRLATRPRLGILHDHADQPRPAQVALAELRAEILVIDASHADRLVI